MRKNPTYQPDPNDGRRSMGARPIRRDGYRSEDELGRDGGRRERQRPQFERGRRNEGYSSEPEQRADDGGEYLRHDPRDYYRRDDRYYNDNDNYPRRDYRPPQFYNPPYYPPVRDMYHPMYMPERDPRMHPYYHQPMYMYNPMDMYHPRYPPGPDGYLMPPQFYPPRRYRPHGNQRNQPSGKSGKKQRVGFEEEVEEQEFDPNEADPYLIAEVERAKIRQRVALLVVIIIFLVASVALGAVAAAMEPWWVQQIQTGATTTFDSIRVGLWRTCYRPNTNIAWKCHGYNENKIYNSPYASITLLQWSMVVASISAFTSLCLAIVVICGRNTRFFGFWVLGIIYTALFFALAATALFGLVIAYVSEDKKALNIVPSWTKVVNADLKSGMMFAIGCAATATSGMSLILCAVFIFIYEPVVKPATEVVENNEEVKRNTNENKKMDKSAPKRQGTKYVKNDRKNVQMNGHANNTPQKGPAHGHKEAPSIKPKHPKTREAPIQNSQPGAAKMGPRQNYPPKDYGTKNTQKVRKELKHQPKAATTQSTPSAVQIYDGDYDQYFNEPY